MMRTESIIQQQRKIKIIQFHIYVFFLLLLFRLARTDDKSEDDPDHDDDSEGDCYDDYDDDSEDFDDESSDEDSDDNAGDDDNPSEHVVPGFGKVTFNYKITKHYEGKLPICEFVLCS